MSKALGNTTLDDNSPAIKYVGAWVGDEHPMDPYVDRYANSTFHASVTTNDTATLSWEGGAIWIYGAKRSNHGWFSISLDSADPLYYSGFSATETFQVLLYASGELDVGQHKVVLRNEKGHAQSSTDLKYVDVDFIVVQANPVQFAESTLANNTQSSSASATSSSSSSATSTKSEVTSASARVTTGTPVVEAAAMPSDKSRTSAAKARVHVEGTGVRRWVGAGMAVLLASAYLI
ncbi:hypothetical protein IAT38_002589 [Cryptococcus sp. DSM 104549]